MPKQDKDINTSKEIQNKQDNKNHKWTIWNQGPKETKETKRKFKQTTPGQVRDYKHFVNQRRFVKYEQVESVQQEDAPVNSVAGGGVDMAPNAKGTKVFMKKYRVDGRTKEYREANRRIKERQERIAQKQVQAKLDMFGVHANPFTEETENKKYLETKPGSIEDAVLGALNPNNERETLTLPKKEEEVDEALGHAGWAGLGNMPKTDPKTGKYVTGNSKIKRVPYPKDHPLHRKPKKEEVEEGFGKLKDASKNLAKMHKAMGIKKDKTTTKKTAQGGTVQTTTYKKANEEKKSGYLEPDMKKRQANNEKARKDMKKMGTPMKNPHLEEVEVEALDLKKIRAQRRAKAAGRMKDVEKVFNKKTKPSRDDKIYPRQDAPSRGYFEEVEIDELSNKTMSSYTQKASASQADAEKKQDYKTADKRISGKLRATRRQFSNDTNRILKGLKKESKETENGERDAGSDKYTNYTKEMTPGQGITNDDAKKADVKKKKEQAAQQQQLNVDEDMKKYLNTKSGSIEEAVFKALMPEAFTTKHEKGDKHDEVPERKAGESEKDHADRKAGRVSFKAHRRSLDAVDPEELKGKHADRDDKDIDNDGDVDGSDRYLHRRRQAIASRRKKDEQKEEVEEVYKYKARGAPSPKYIQGPARRYDSPLDSPKAIAAREKLRRVMRGIKKKDPDHPAVQNVKEEEVNIDELSKKTLGSYVKKASVDKSNATLDLGISQGPKQTRADVTKHAGKAIKRQKGIDKAVDKLSKEEVELTPSEMFENLVAAKRNQLPRQLKDPKKEKMVSTKSGTKVVNKNDPKYRNAPEHEAYQPTKTPDTIMGVKVKKIPAVKRSFKDRARAQGVVRDTSGKKTHSEDV